MTDQPTLPGMPTGQCPALPPDRRHYIDRVDGTRWERRCTLPNGHTGHHHYAWHEPRYLDVISELVK